MRARAAAFFAVVVTVVVVFRLGMYVVCHTRPRRTSRRDNRAARAGELTPKTRHQWVRDARWHRRPSPEVAPSLAEVQQFSCLTGQLVEELALPSTDADQLDRVTLERLGDVVVEPAVAGGRRRPVDRQREAACYDLVDVLGPGGCGCCAAR